jgi:hypothetical protein
VRWRGRREIIGMWLPTPWQDSRRLEQVWRPHSRLLQSPLGWVVLYSEAVTRDCDGCLGLPLAKAGLGWASTPQLKAGPGQIALLWQGQPLCDTPQNWPEVPLDSLWDSPDWSFEYPPAGTSKQVLEVAKDPATLKEVLPSVPVPLPQREDILDRLRKASSTPLLGFFDLLRSFFGDSDNQRYVKKMLDLFERQQWNEALRYALPIDPGISTLGWQKFLGKLMPRSGLKFTSPFSSGWAVGTSLQGLDWLTGIYRKALDKMVQSGRIEEAAFMLGEILHDPAAAVELLESHGLFEQAAKLATLKGLPAALQIRLWFLCRKVDSALELARRFEAHADAMTQLESKNPERTDEFRRYWAEDLARAARFGEALQVGWSVRTGLSHYSDWLRHCLKQDGAASHSALALCLVDPDLREAHQLVRELRRRTLTCQLSRLPEQSQLLERLKNQAGAEEVDDPDLQGWARDMARRLMRASTGPFPLGDSSTLAFLIRVARDPWLAHDRPPRLPKSDLRLGSWQEAIPQRGFQPIWDALPVGDGQMLVALGHSGLRLLSPQGERLAHFDIPAHRLIWPQQGERILIISGQRCFLYLRGQLKPWFSLDLDGFCEHHSGFQWLAWRGERLYAFDLCQEERLLALQEVKLPHPVRRLALGSNRLCVGTSKTVHTFEYPSLKALQSGNYQPKEMDLLTPTGSLYLTKNDKGWHIQGHRIPLDGQDLRGDWSFGYALISSHTEQGMSVLAVHPNQAGQPCLFHLPHSSRVEARVVGRYLLLVDDCGRVLLFDLKRHLWMNQLFL